MNIGVVFGQRTQLWWDIPLNETYTLLKNMYDIPEDAYRERFEFLDGVLGLHEFIMQPVRTLSLGQRMMADLAAALIHNPKVVFLDEPTIGLDVVVKEKVREAIREINRRYNTTFILTTHDLHDIEELSTRIIVIDKGVKGSAVLPDICRSVCSNFVFSGGVSSWKGKSFSGAVSACDNCGCIYRRCVSILEKRPCTLRERRLVRWVCGTAGNGNSVTF